MRECTVAPAKPGECTPPSPASEAATWCIEVIEDQAAFEGLRDGWSRLVRSDPGGCLFRTWEWTHAWWIHRGRPPLAIVAVRRDRSLVGIAPLFTRPGLVRQCELMGSGTVGSDYLDLIVDHEHRAAVLSAIAEHFRRLPCPLVLEQVAMAGSHVDGLMSLLEKGRWRRSAEVTNLCPYVDLRGHTWESYLETLGASHRYNLRRRLRQLESRFRVELELVGTETRRREALDALIALHLGRWSDRGGSEAFERRALIEFHHDFTRLALEREWLRLYVLRLDGRPAAAIYGLSHNNRFLFYQSGFDDDFARYSVGMVILGLTIRAAIGEGLHEYDLLHGDESYKFSWTKEAREIGRFEAYPPTLAGALSLQRRRAVVASKRAIRTWLPEPAVDALARMRGR